MGPFSFALCTFHISTEVWIALFACVASFSCVYRLWNRGQERSSRALTGDRSSRSSITKEGRRRLLSMDAFKTRNRSDTRDAFSPQHVPFDEIAGSYDKNFTETRVGSVLRRRTWRIFLDAFRDGVDSTKSTMTSRILELSCGTGEDTFWLCSQGFEVLATDYSDGMLSVAKEKCKALTAQCGEGRMPEFRRLDLRDSTSFRSIGERASFAGAFSNFGGLNNVHARHFVSIANNLAHLLRPGARAILVVMPRSICLWELLYYASRCDTRRAFRRYVSSADGIAVSVGSQKHNVYFHTSREIEHAFCSNGAFRLRRCCAIGLFLPPSMWSKRVSRWMPGFCLRVLGALEGTFAGSWPFSGLGDHFLLEFERVGGV